MPLGLGKNKYSVLARDDLSNQIEGTSLRAKTTEGVCRFFFKNVIC